MPRAFAAIAILFAFCIAAAGAAREQGATPYGTSKFESYAEIDKVKQPKVVWDFNFQDPKSVGVMLNNLNALPKATTVPSSPFTPYNKGDRGK